MEIYECEPCEGHCQIVILKEPEKGTEPKIEFCFFCGMSNQYPKKTEMETL